MNRAYSHRIRTLLAGVAIACVFCASPARAEDGFRNFEDVEGRTISGRVVAFDDAQQIVSFQRETDGKILKVKLTVFSQPDRVYIRQWSMMNKTMSGFNISATIYTSDRRDSDAGNSDMNGVISSTGYKITLNTTSSNDLGRVRVEYCLFYQQGIRKSEGMIYDEGISCGGGYVDLDKDHPKGSFKTTPVKLFNTSSMNSLFGRLNESSGRVKGIWVRVQIAMPSGERYTQEFRTSNDPDWKWISQSVDVGLNKKKK